jgi:hypothetical protein
VREVNFPGGQLDPDRRSVTHAPAPHRSAAAPVLGADGMTTQAHQEEIGQAQVAYRTENEAIQASADKLTLLGPIPFVCECPDRGCSEIVRLSFDEYEAIRQYPRRFFNVSGHETASVEAGAERILLVAGDLTVVEKIGCAGDVADAHQRPG